MNKINIAGINEKIYHEVLDNGLNVYIYKSKGYLKKGAYFLTKYGSADNDFKPVDEAKIRSFPKGIAHFLEHKLFESNDNDNTFSKFSKYGASVNAYTNHTVTNYYFSCTNNFDKCLNLLIDFVQNPYFTDKNVEKEKGIINQEINMTDDDTDRFIFEKLYYNSLICNPNKYKTIGDKKSIKMITKEDLYKCYHTFYNPSNMVLVIYGDVDVQKTFELVKQNQAKKRFEKNNIVLKNYVEKEEVYKKEDYYNRHVKVPKTGVCYKIKLPILNELEKYKKSMFISMFLDIKFSGTSSFESDLLKNNIIEDELSYTYSYFDDTILIFFIVSTNKHDEFIKALDKEIKSNIFDEKMFNINKRAYLASFVKAFENPNVVATTIFNQHVKYGKIINNVYDIYNNYTYKKFMKECSNLNLDNKAVIRMENSK